MKKLYIASIAALIMSATPAQAAKKFDIMSDLQVGGGIGFANMGNLGTGILFYGTVEKGLPFEMGPVEPAAQIRIGTSTKGSTSTFGVKTTESISYFFSALFKGKWEFKDKLSLYGLAGLSYTSMDRTVSTPTFFGTVTSNSTKTYFGPTVAVGLNYELNKHLNVGGELKNLNSEVTAFSANASFEF